MFAYAKLATLSCLSLTFLLAACTSRPAVEDARKVISRFDEMSPAEVLCNPNELSAFRSAVRRYAKAQQDDGVLWPDFSYKNARPDDLTITVLAGQYVMLISPKDIGKAAWHLGELKPEWSSFGAYADGDALMGRPNPALLRNGAKYACSDLVDYGRALAEHQLSEAYWQERVIRETVLQDRPWKHEASLISRADKRMSNELRQVMRMERDLAEAIDAAQLKRR
jgi:hypothetical protein